MSSYAGFAVQIRDRYGVLTNVGAGISVAVRADGAGSDAAESPLTTDSNGEISAGTLAAVAAGTLVHFRVENNGGTAGSASQVTT
jgi:hypothetical protein